MRLPAFISMLQIPSDHALWNRVGPLWLLTSFSIFWFFGINGSNIMSLIFTPILTALTLEKPGCYCRQFALPKHYQSRVWCSFALFVEDQRFASDCDIFVLQILAVQKTLQRFLLRLVFWYQRACHMDCRWGTGTPIIYLWFLRRLLTLNCVVRNEPAWRLCATVLCCLEVPLLDSDFFCGWRGALLPLVLIFDWYGNLPAVN